ncbi:LysR substrate-binding domain-containing protein [Mesorhizobium sp. STM 4661]|uniref:LysR substrate-binding domain-containing protein n=1 Tax=Mesorhizobium sp. STM 4661 TaxID=1297570 RepID=UPI0002C01402|nr:LysR substrate-binding domain-containing protein [Mesorhizobium sp. STM 4661]CCV13729.1 Transcriptional regulator, LysR family [Mesorhizobium sp. STM 4661]
MDVQQIEAYQAVMTYGTTSRAAELLGVSQPAISKAIISLERSIGFKLFDREKGRLIPSAEGQLFFREVEISLAGIAKLRSAAARIRDFGSGDLRIACLSAFSTNLVPRAIGRFRRKNPEIVISFVVRESSAIRDLVASNHLDLAITADEINKSGVEALPFADVRAMLALQPGHPLRHKDVIEPSDLDQLPFVALAPEDTTRREAEAIFAKHGVSPRVVVETAYSSTICALVLAGNGCGIVDPINAAGYVERGLILKPFRPAIHFRTLMLFPPKKRSWVVEQMVEALCRERESLIQLDENGPWRQCS